MFSVTCRSNWKHTYQTVLWPFHDKLCY